MAKDVGSVETRKGYTYKVRWDPTSGKVLVENKSGGFFPSAWKDTGLRVKGSGEALVAAKSYLDNR